MAVNFFKKGSLKKIILVVLFLTLPLLLFLLSRPQSSEIQAALTNLLQAEDAPVKQGNLTTESDSAASGGKYIRFNAVSNPTSKPSTVPTIPSGDRPYFGYAVDTSQIANYGDHILRYGAQIIAPANSMKMQTIGGCNGNYNYSKADSILNFAKSNGLIMHGHTLVWYSQTSSCAGSFSKTDLKNYIQNVMRHYCGKLYSMDVVNEALADGGGYRTGSTWYQLYGGTGYIEDAFRWAREACPSMKLYYNDYSIETYGQAKTTSMLSLVRNLKNKGLIDGVGFQAHWTRSFDKTAWGRTMDEVAAMGLEFAISEMDVRFEKNYWDISQSELNLQAQTYRNAAELCNTRSACHHMIIWGVHDGDSWINSWLGVSDAPLLFTRQLSPKPAYCDGVRPVFNLPKGSCP